MNTPTPEKIMQVVSGGWACAVVGAAASHSIFTHLEAGADTAEAVARKAGISNRGAQAILDGVVGLGLATVKNGRYANTPDASTFLVEGKHSCMAGLAKLNVMGLAQWAGLPEVVRTGAPAGSMEEKENPFWELLVPSIAPLSFPAAHASAERLGLAKAGPVAILDVGGGSGIFSAIWLKVNAAAKSTQIDWANVNRIARDYVARFGVGDRFSTVDGDFHAVDFGKARFDFALYSHIAHGESPKENVETFRKFRAALKPGGTFVIQDFVLADDRSGPPFALLFHANMLLMSRGGATYRQADYRAWLAEAGFSSVSIEPLPGPASLIYAR